VDFNEFVHMQQRSTNKKPAAPAKPAVAVKTPATSVEVAIRPAATVEQPKASVAEQPKSSQAQPSPLLEEGVDLGSLSHAKLATLLDEVMQEQRRLMDEVEADPSSAATNLGRLRKLQDQQKAILAAQNVSKAVAPPSSAAPECLPGALPKGQQKISKKEARQQAKEAKQEAKRNQVEAKVKAKEQKRLAPKKNWRGKVKV